MENAALVGLPFSVHVTGEVYENASVGMGKIEVLSGDREFFAILISFQKCTEIPEYILFTISPDNSGYRYMMHDDNIVSGRDSAERLATRQAGCRERHI